MEYLLLSCVLGKDSMFSFTERKLSKYGVFSGPSFAVFSPNTEKYGPEKTPYLDTFHAVFQAAVSSIYFNSLKKKLLKSI